MTSPRFKKVVCAYSGGLDTSVMIPWLKENYGCEIITYTGDLGQGEDLSGVKAKALRTGASDAVVDDLQDRFVQEFIWPAVKASALYEGQYPLHTALGRPLLARRLVEVARDFGADAIAHGCTGKGNDQVRFEVTSNSLAPDLGVVAPLRTWELLTREMEVDYAVERGIEIPITREKPYSIDKNLWGCAIECGEMEDLWNEPPADAWQMTKDPSDAPRGSVEITLSFEKGVPVAIDGVALSGVKLIQQLNELAGHYGVGRIDMVENRVVGLKSREVYEAPAATLIHMGHIELERICLDRATFNYKQKVAQDFANIIYNGTWYGPLRDCLQSFVERANIHLTGEVRIRVSAGLARITGRRSPFSLYDEGLATYSDGDTFKREHAEGFMELYGLPYKTVAAVRRASGDDPLND
ncbi:MAG: argininosuccinate synthase [Deltaproteobacteria bacterium]|nr:argininosuccinate synthase [Deltaproteobacteria bacterium]